MYPTGHTKPIYNTTKKIQSKKNYVSRLKYQFSKYFLMVTYVNVTQRSIHDRVLLYVK